MNKEDFDKYIKDRYEMQKAWYDRKATENQKAYQRNQWATVVLAALTPFLIIIGEGWLKWLAVGVAIAVAITTGAVRAFKYHENWINYRTTCETLKKEINFYKANTQGYESADDKEQLFVERVEALISRENTLWVTTHAQHEDQKCK